MKVMTELSLLESRPPNIISPFVSLKLFVGAKETVTDCVSIRPSENAFSVTVGTVLPSEVVPTVKSLGPILSQRNI